MVNLAMRSIIVLALLFGLVFAIGVMALVATGLPFWLAVPFAVIVVALQYLLGPFILQWIYKCVVAGFMVESWYNRRPSDGCFQETSAF